jgi:hypothetical protein
VELKYLQIYELNRFKTRSELRCLEELELEYFSTRTSRSREIGRILTNVGHTLKRVTVRGPVDRDIIPIVANSCPLLEVLQIPHFDSCAFDLTPLKECLFLRHVHVIRGHLPRGLRHFLSFCPKMSHIRLNWTCFGSRSDSNHRLEEAILSAMTAFSETHPKRHVTLELTGNEPNTGSNFILLMSKMGFTTYIMRYNPREGSSSQSVRGNLRVKVQVNPTLG